MSTNAQTLTNEQMGAWAFVKRYIPDATLEEALAIYTEYRSYRDEGQSDLVARQYAGLL